MCTCCALSILVNSLNLSLEIPNFSFITMADALGICCLFFHFLDILKIFLALSVNILLKSLSSCVGDASLVSPDTIERNFRIFLEGFLFSGEPAFPELFLGLFIL